MEQTRPTEYLRMALGAARLGSEANMVFNLSHYYASKGAIKSPGVESRLYQILSDSLTRQKIQKHIDLGLAEISEKGMKVDGAYDLTMALYMISDFIKEKAGIEFRIEPKELDWGKLRENSSA